jgi:hypothetical protein
MHLFFLRALCASVPSVLKKPCEHAPAWHRRADWKVAFDTEDTEDTEAQRTRRHGDTDKLRHSRQARTCRVIS